MLCSRCVYFCACCLDHSDVIDRSSNKRTNEKTLTRPHLAKDKESGTHFSDLSVPASCATSPNMWQRQCSSFFPTSLHSSLSELRPRTFIIRARSDDRAPRQVSAARGCHGCTADSRLPKLGLDSHPLI